jgi:hypothetical protein
MTAFVIAREEWLTLRFERVPRALISPYHLPKRINKIEGYERPTEQFVMVACGALAIVRCHFPWLGIDP